MILRVLASVKVSISAAFLPNACLKDRRVRFSAAGLRKVILPCLSAVIIPSPMLLITVFNH